MKQAFNTALEGVAFAIRAGGYERHAYVGSLNGGVHFPTTCVIEIYDTNTASNK